MAALVVACGDDVQEQGAVNLGSPDAGIGADAEDEEIPITKNCEGPYDETLVQGRFWSDPEDVAVSYYIQPMSDAASGFEDREVRLLVPDAPEQITLSCADGTFRFPGVDADIALLDVGTDDCTSANCPTNFARQATIDGAVKVVTFGDSIPHFGPQPWFPARLAELASPLVDVDNTNVAVPGSTSVEWVPDSQYFRNRIEPHTDADVWVFSLGGNDLRDFADQAMGNPDPTTLLNELQPLVDEIVVNIRQTVQQVRSISPDSDIVWVLYPNYGRTAYWKSLVGPQYESIVETAVGNLLSDVRMRLSGESGLHVVDMLEATKDEDLDAMLFDPLHLNETGHSFYARELFITLGGVIIEGESRGLDRSIGYVE